MYRARFSCCSTKNLSFSLHLQWERKSNLRRFEGSSSISSADYFGTESSTPSSSLSMRLGAGRAGVVDLDDVRESVRQGVNKVAGRLSSFANAAVSSIQDRYGL